MSDKPNKQVRYEYIDALRGWAILGVIATHTLYFSEPTYYPILEALFDSGSRGVQLFFIISAFTVFLSFERSQGKSKTMLVFFIKRFFRIIPVYYIGLLLVVWKLGELPIGSALTNLFFIHDFFPQHIGFVNGGGWSIGIEMTFYICVPFIFKYVKSLDKAVLLLVVSMCIHSFCTYFITKYNLIDRTYPNFLFYYFPSQLPIFIMGICYYFFSKNDRFIKPQTLLFLIGYVLFYFSTYSFLQLPTHYFFGICFFTLLYILSQKPYFLFVNKITIFYGKISYSLYMFHFFVLFYMMEKKYFNYLSSTNFITFNSNLFLNFAILTIFSTIIAYLSYILVEKPTIKLAKYFIKKVTNPTIKN